MMIFTKHIFHDSSEMIIKEMLELVELNEKSHDVDIKDALDEA